MLVKILHWSGDVQSTFLATVQTDPTPQWPEGAETGWIHVPNHRPPWLSFLEFIQSARVNGIFLTSADWISPCSIVRIWQA